MQRALKRKGIVLVGLVGVLILAAGAVYAISEYCFSRLYDTQVEKEYKTVNDGTSHLWESGSEK